MQAVARIGRRRAVAVLTAPLVLLAACGTPPTQPTPKPTPSSPDARIVRPDAPRPASPHPAPRGDPAPAASSPPPAPAEVPADAAPSPAALPTPAPDADDRGAVERGISSWYGRRFHGRRTANGERFDMHALTAAHRTLPFGTRVHVRNPANGREVVVRINDRGPTLRDRMIDLSRAAARRLGIGGLGTVEIRLLPTTDESGADDAPAAD
jgi:rare lipoprotein A